LGDEQERRLGEKDREVLGGGGRITEGWEKDREVSGGRRGKGASRERRNIPNRGLISQTTLTAYRGDPALKEQTAVHESENSSSLALLQPSVLGTPPFSHLSPCFFSLSSSPTST
jgi:hypothetical protein